MGGNTSKEEQPFFDYGDVFNISLKKTIVIPGEVLQGTIILNATRLMPIFTVNVGLKGDSHTHWTEQHGSGKNRRTVHYRGHNVIIDEAKPAFATGDQLLPSA